MASRLSSVSCFVNIVRLLRLVAYYVFLEGRRALILLLNGYKVY